MGGGGERGRERGRERPQELCSESRDGRPGLSVPKSAYGLCGRKATLNSNKDKASHWLLSMDLRGLVIALWSMTSL